MPVIASVPVCDVAPTPCLIRIRHRQEQRWLQRRKWGNMTATAGSTFIN